MPEEMMDDDFGSAFADALKGYEDPGDQDPPAEAAPETPDEPADDPAQGDPAEGEAAQADPTDHPDPQTGDDPAPSDTADDPPAPAAPDDDIEQLKTKAHGYDSMFGRLDQVRRENDQLKQRLAQLEQMAGGQQEPQQAQSGQPQSFAPQAAQIPEEIREEVQEFQRQYPHFAELVSDQGQVGQSLRKLLADYGPEVAAIQADSVVTRNQLQQQVQQVQQTFEQDRAQQLVEQKRSALLGNHPELAAVADIGADGRLYARQGKEQDLQGYLQGVDTWIRSLPYGEAENWMRIQREGSPAEVSQLLSAYHKQTQSQQPAAQHDPKRSAKAAAAGAVPSRRASLPKAEPAPDDFSGAFAAALAE